MNKEIMINLVPFERKIFINKHLILYNESLSRVLVNFKDIQKETYEYRETLIKETQANINELSCNEQNKVHSLIWRQTLDYMNGLKNIQREVSLSILSMMYFNFDKSLRNWISLEVSRSNWDIQSFEKWIWSEDINKIYQLLKLFNFDVKLRLNFTSLDAMRLIVNVYKHGKGSSFKKLKENYGQYLNAKSCERGFQIINNEHSLLKIDEVVLQNFSNSIVKFWEQIPEQMHISNVESISEFIKPKKGG